MLLSLVHANGFHFDVNMQAGGYYSKLGLKGFDFNVLAFNAGYRWVFKKSRLFLDWDFFSMSSGSIASFKIGRLFHNNKLALYSILTPFAFNTFATPVQLSTKKFGIGEHFIMGGNIGIGSSYKVHHNVSLVGEFRTAFSYPNTPIFLVKTNVKTWETETCNKEMHTKPIFVFRGSLGVQFHSASINN